MTDYEKKQLLDSVLGGDELAGARQASLEGGLRALRRRRQGRTAGLSFLIVAAALVLLLPQREQPVTVVQEQAAPAAPKFERITKEQLFALFPGRAMALVGKPGEQELVFLDQQQTANR